MGVEGDLGALDDLMADLMDDRDDLEINFLQDEEEEAIELMEWKWKQACLLRVYLGFKRETAKYKTRTGEGLLG